MESSKKDLLRGSSWILFGNLFSKILVFCATIAVTHILTKDLYGQLGIIHHNIDLTQVVKRFGLATEIFRKEKRTQFTSNQKELPQEVPVESISDYGFSDLEMLIYTRVIVKGQ